jgi:hypothetical protein
MVLFLQTQMVPFVTYCDEQSSVEQHPHYRCLMRLARLQTHVAPFSLSATGRSHSANITMPGGYVFAGTSGTMLTLCHG